MESPKSAERLMTPTADTRGRGIFVTEREAVSLLLALDRAAAWSPLPVAREETTSTFRPSDLSELIPRRDLWITAAAA
jgi:hypothetical protein